ncbi:MAG: TraB/GumN family protein, partial [Pseudomonadota bacterium]
VYLFGTFHALKPGIEWFSGPVRTAYESADEVALEATDTLDAQRMGELVLRYAIDPDGRTLSSVVGPDLAGQLGERLSTMGVPLAQIEPMEPWMAVMTLAQLQMQAAGFNPMLGVDVTLQQSAAEAGKTLTGIEGAEAQLKLLDGFPEERQIAWLAMSLRDWDEAPEMLNDMLDAWSTGDVARFADEMVESMEEVPNLNQVLMVDRNEGFADWIAERMAQPGIVFMAIGAGHLAGPDSVQDFLRADGITPTRL